MKRLSINPLIPEPEVIKETVECLRNGGLVIVPTDTVYGIVASLFNPHAIERIYEVKSRDADKPLPVFVGNLSQVEELSGNVPENVKQLCKEYWPGPLTVVLPCARKDLDRVTRCTGKIGVRWPSLPLIDALLQELGAPLASTSANLSTEPACKSLDCLQPSFLDKMDIVLDAGNLGSGVPSTVVDITQTKFKILRQGEITELQINRFNK